MIYGYKNDTAEGVQVLSTSCHTRKYRYCIVCGVVFYAITTPTNSMAT